MKKLLLCFLWSLYIPVVDAQQVEKADFTRAMADITIDPHKQEVSGKVTYFFDVLRPFDSLYIDARNMDFGEIWLNGKQVKFHNDGSRLWILSRFTPSEDNKLELPYKATPEKAMYFVGWDTEGAQKQVWTQGQGRYTSNWLPSFDDVNEKVEFDLSITFDKRYKVLANGFLEGFIESDSLYTWKYDMKHPMSSYLLAVAIGKYDMIRDFSRGGIPLEMYYYPGHRSLSEPTYRYTKEIFDLLEEEIGVPYPWQTYKQAPVKDFLHGGMENTSLTLFSDMFMVDSVGYNDMNYINVNAHELAHQWFGNMVTARDDEHHWLHEGFATYYALLAEKAIFGEDHYYWQLYQSVQKLMDLSRKGKGEAVLNPGASSLTFYEKGAFALHILRETIGDKAFKKGVKAYLEKFRYGNATTSGFISEVERAAGKSLDDFTDTWLKQSTFPEEEALRSLKKSEFIRTLLAIKEGEITGDEKEKLLWSDIYFPVKQEIIFQQNAKGADVEWNKELFETGDLYMRQALALSLDTIPEALKTAYETLLDDRSYVTVEHALIKLWMNFTPDAPEYLDRTGKLTGFSNKNIRIPWLGLALSAPHYPSGGEADRIRAKNGWKDELIAYTSPRYPYYVRQKAFSMLYQLGLLHDTEALKNLVNACVHHTWSFTRESRELLDRLVKNEAYNKKIRELMPGFGTKERAFLEEVME